MPWAWRQLVDWDRCGESSLGHPRLLTHSWQNKVKKILGGTKSQINNSLKKKGNEYVVFQVHQTDFIFELTAKMNILKTLINVL